MHTPQIIFIVLVAMAGGIVLANHGKPKGNYNFYAWVLSAAIQIGLMYWGGFFG